MANKEQLTEYDAYTQYFEAKGALDDYRKSIGESPATYKPAKLRDMVDAADEKAEQARRVHNRGKDKKGKVGSRWTPGADEKALIAAEDARRQENTRRHAAIAPRAPASVNPMAAGYKPKASSTEPPPRHWQDDLSSDGSTDDE